MVLNHAETSVKEYHAAFSKPVAFCDNYISFISKNSVVNIYRLTTNDAKND